MCIYIYMSLGAKRLNFPVYDYSSYRFQIQNGPIRGYALSPLLLNFALVRSIGISKKTKRDVKRKRRISVYTFAVGVNLLARNVNNIKKRTELLRFKETTRGR